MLNFLKSWLHGRQRRIDVMILWPSIKAQAPNIDRAREAFWVHCSYDPAWSDYNAAALHEYIEVMT